MNGFFNKVLIGIFFLSIAALSLSTHLAARSFEGKAGLHISLPSSSISQESKTPKETSQASVLGETTERSLCISREEYLQAVSHVRPDVVMYFGTDEQVVTNKQLVSCLAEISQISEQNNCPVYQFSLNETCLETLLTSSIKFPEPQESLRSNTTGKQVNARIRDEVVDYAALAKEVGSLYEKNTEFEKVTNMYATIKPLLLQVPTMNKLPSTDGLVASRYLEFDGSRQLMFMWEKGKYKTFRMSGAFPEYNPVGIFTILNKSPLAWSSTANKWMPYWQAFVYDKDQRAMLGIHALVYWYPGFEKTGSKKIFESESHIGTPRSTGCLRFTLEDAKKIYEWAHVGDLLVVHN